MSDEAMHALAITATSFADPSTVELRVPREEERGPWWEAEKYSWWEDIDYGVPMSCGWCKCFFTSAGDPERGYVIEPEHFRDGTPGKFRTAKAAYLYEKMLESTHGIRSTSVSPPILAETPEYFRERVYEVRKEVNSKVVQMSKVGHVIVQPAHKAPEGSVVWKCSDVSPWIEGGRAGTLLGELEALIPLVESHVELVWDFQVLIDPEGRVYHFDLDRAMQNLGSTQKLRELRTCLENNIARLRSNLGFHVV